MKGYYNDDYLIKSLASILQSANWIGLLDI